MATAQFTVKNIKVTEDNGQKCKKMVKFLNGIVDYLKDIYKWNENNDLLHKVKFYGAKAKSNPAYGICISGIFYFKEETSFCKVNEIFVKGFYDVFMEIYKNNPNFRISFIEKCECTGYEGPKYDAYHKYYFRIFCEHNLWE